MSQQHRRKHSPLLPLDKVLMIPSRANVSSSRLAHTRGTTSASAPSSPPPRIPSLFAPTAAPRPISRQKSRTQKNGNSSTQTKV
jgi:hypothetical protein